MGYAKPTPIQAQAIPALMAGPRPHRHRPDRHRQDRRLRPADPQPPARQSAPGAARRRRVLVLSPTRELASQIAESFRDLERRAAVRDRRGVRRRAARRADQGAGARASTCSSRPPAAWSITWTPASRSSGDVEFFVLDEVDQMLDLGFVKPIRRIVRDLPNKRQNLFFSATMPTDIRKLAGELLRDPVEVAVTPVAKTADRVDQQIIFVDAPRKRDMLVELFTDAEMSRVHRLHPHQARRRPRRADARRGGDRARSPSTATRARASASARSPRSAAARRARWSPPTSPRAASTSTGSAMSSISNCPRSPRPTCTGSAAPRAPATAATRFRCATATERELLRNIERLTRLRIFTVDRRGANGPAPAPVLRKATPAASPERAHTPHNDPRRAGARPAGQPHRARQGRRTRPAFQARSAPAR